MTIRLNGSNLTVTQVVAAARHGEAVSLEPERWPSCANRARWWKKYLMAASLAIAGSPDDALSELAVAGQAITVEARTLAHPVSYELASSVTGEGIEDRATMAPLSARRLADMIQLCARVAAIEFVVAAQAIDLRALPDAPDGLGGLHGAAQLGLGTARVYRMIRELVPFTHGDGTLPADLEPLVELVCRGDLTAVA